MREEEGVIVDGHLCLIHRYFLPHPHAICRIEEHLVGLPDSPIVPGIPVPVGIHDMRRMPLLRSPVDIHFITTGVDIVDDHPVIPKAPVIADTLPVLERVEPVGGPAWVLTIMALARTAARPSSLTVT
jgi:hypothetical protein